MRFVDLPVGSLREPVWLDAESICQLVGVRRRLLRLWVHRGHVTKRDDGLMDLRQVWTYAMRDTHGRH